jgi:hypothetical protein
LTTSLLKYFKISKPGSFIKFKSQNSKGILLKFEKHSNKILIPFEEHEERITSKKFELTSLK